MYMILVYSVFGSDRIHCSGLILQLKNISSFLIGVLWDIAQTQPQICEFIKY